MSEGNFTRCFEHVNDNTESEIDEAITSAFDHVVQWLEEEQGKDVKSALERREVNEQFSNRIAAQSLPTLHLSFFVIFYIL